MRELSVDFGVLEREIVVFVDREREERRNSSFTGWNELGIVMIAWSAGSRRISVLGGVQERD